MKDSKFWVIILTNGRSFKVLSPTKEDALLAMSENAEVRLIQEVN